MQFTHVDKKSGLNVIATAVAEGRFTVQYEDGTSKEVAEATFKRWFKKLDVAPVAEVVEVALVEEVPVADEFHIVDHHQVATPKGTKVIDTILYRNVQIVITEYGGFITDVRVNDAAGTEVFRSAKMSVKDTLTNFFNLSDDAFKAARSAITNLRKSARAAH